MSQKTFWFERNIVGSPFPNKLSSLYYDMTRQRQQPYDYYGIPPEAGTFVMGFVLPPFQRDSVWTDDQKIKFIDSARQCIPLGTFTVNKVSDLKNATLLTAGGIEYAQCDYWLLDGLQRMLALQDFFDDRLRVHGALWSELSEEDQKQFLHTVRFDSMETNFLTVEACMRYYNLMNFSGTPHSPDQTAERVMESKGLSF